MQDYPGRCQKTLKICGVHVGRNIKGTTKGWLPKCCVYIGECTKGTQRDDIVLVKERQKMDSTWFNPGAHKKWTELTELLAQCSGLAKVAFVALNRGFNWCLSSRAFDRSIWDPSVPKSRSKQPSDVKVLFSQANCYPPVPIPMDSYELWFRGDLRQLN